MTTLDPQHTAVLTMELQRGICGDLSPMAALTRLVDEAGLPKAVARLLEAARPAGARVVHCTFELRADRAGTSLRPAMMAALARRPEYLLEGTDAVALLPGLGPEPGDLVSARRHGFTPFLGTDLDLWLRNMGVDTVVVTGVTLNMGIIGAALEAVNLGYAVDVPTDAVIGMPVEYGEAVLRNSLAPIVTLTTVAEVISAWA
jgi:nicotinamidase-related amidase